MDRASRFNYSVTPLTRSSAEGLGHVGWIEESNLHSALSSMFNAINNDTANIAVWANAQEISNPEDSELVSTWRSDFQFASCRIGTGSIRRNKLEKDLQQLTQIFMGQPSYSRKHPAESRVIPAVNAFLHRRALDTINSLFQITPAKSVALDVRAGPIDLTRSPHAPHIDGASSGLLRLLDTLDGPSTIFVSNDYVCEIPGKKHPQYEVIDEPFWPFWACPERSLVLLANDFHGKKPVAHNPPFTPPGASPVARAHLVYDLYF